MTYTFENHEKKKSNFQVFFHKEQLFFFFFFFFFFFCQTCSLGKVDKKMWKKKKYKMQITWTFQMHEKKKFMSL